MKNIIIENEKNSKIPIDNYWFDTNGKIKPEYKEMTITGYNHIFDYELPENYRKYMIYITDKYGYIKTTSLVINDIKTISYDKIMKQIYDYCNSSNYKFVSFAFNITFSILFLGLFFGKTHHFRLFFSFFCKKYSFYSFFTILRNFVLFLLCFLKIFAIFSGKSFPFCTNLKTKEFYSGIIHHL